MTANLRIYIIGMGIISPMGCGLAQTQSSVGEDRKGIRPLTIFPSHKTMPVGEIVHPLHREDDVPRTHVLSLMAAREAMADITDIPQAIVLGGTTGGILTTEEHLKAKNYCPELFRYHSVSSVAEYLARKLDCKGPVISVSTACSSGTAAIAIAVEMLRTGKVKNVLAGGSDSLCRLTYYGFNSLQLIDAHGARPFDKNRKGMTISEGSAMLFLTADSRTPDHAVAEILGTGLSCDAHHATAPHPEGKGAIRAMTAAIEDAGISSFDIDYINLHGTGTPDNDLSEAIALHTIWGDKLPYLSSIKGAFGHSLAAAGAIEAVVSAMSISDRLIPANTGCHEPDPKLNIHPVESPLFDVTADTVLSNSFGFGGNNASVVLGNPRKERRPVSLRTSSPFFVIGSSCITGAGNTENTLNALLNGMDCKGTADIEEISADLPSRLVRRLKRLPRISLSLALSACQKSKNPPSSIFLGTGWGGLSETHDFLTQLYESDERFTSPTDFISSVHNASAGQIAIHLKSAGPNITATTGDYSFDHALWIADLLTKNSDESLLVIGADEYHSVFSPLFDPSVSGSTPSDGGGAVCLTKKPAASSVKLCPLFLEYAHNNPSVISSLIQNLGGSAGIKERFGSILVGIPHAFGTQGKEQMRQFLSVTGFCNPIIDYRKLLGEFASASASAAVIAIRFILNGKIPAPICGNNTDFDLNGKSILMMNLGDFVTAAEVSRS